MSCYVRQIENWPEKELCPHHGIKFKKKGKFWCCPYYGDCGYSIGSRPLVGHVNRMWIKQSKKGKAFMQRIFDDIRRCTEIVPYDPPQQGIQQHPAPPTLFGGILP